jgi:hypothetical protein
MLRSNRTKNNNSMVAPAKHLNVSKNTVHAKKWARNVTLSSASAFNAKIIYEET